MRQRSDRIEMRGRGAAYANPRQGPGDRRRVRRRQGPRRLVGMGRHQARARIAVLVGADHHRNASAELRAGLRPDRTRHPACHPRPVDAGQARHAAGFNRAVGAGAGHRHRDRSLRLLPPRSRRHPRRHHVARRRRRSAPGGGRRLLAARLPSPEREDPATDRGARAARTGRSTHLGTSAPSGCSASATRSASIPRRPSAPTATTFCPSSSATGSSHVLISKATARPCGSSSAR